MITPSKHTDIRYSVLFLSNRIISYLKRENIIKVDDLFDMLIADLGNKVKNNVNETLLFLYAFNKIEYIKELDAISLIEKENNEN
ncbi:MAG TPA: hypothetical protein ENK44_09625 [Caldithrix abyssi]|uniref:Uncharacterized protein n=1 Tax=Caldithrix abyssi TaxID=187145 RepID=A0A7V4U0W8_CALAY|nr:hypothetical protein [Caldithrix abyssi]